MAISFERHKKLVVALFLLTGVAGTFGRIIILFSIQATRVSGSG